MNIEETNSQEAKPLQSQESENEEDNEISEMINEILSYSNSEPEDEEEEQVKDTSESSTNCPSTAEIGEQERAFESQEARKIQFNNNETNQFLASEINHQQDEAINIEETNSQEAKQIQGQESENEKDNEISEMINEISSYSNSEPEDEEEEQVKDTSESSTNCPSTPEIGEQERAFESQEARKIIKVLKDNEYLPSTYIVDGKRYSSMKCYSSINDSVLVQPHIIYRIWISNSPKQQESVDLLEFFKHKHKPTLYIGYVYQYTSEDRQGLKKLLDAEFKLEVWDNVSREMYPRYEHHIDQYIKSVKNEWEEVPETEPESYSPEDVVPIALGEVGITHLVCEGRLYRSSGKNRHAEVIFVNDIRNRHIQVQKIHKIWIKNSPCFKCCNVLIKLFEQRGSERPTIFIGNIIKPKDKKRKNFKGMVKLKSEGFKLQIWESFNKPKYGRLHEETIAYLNLVNRAAHNY